MHGAPLSEDGENWGEPIAQGAFEPEPSRQVIDFGRKVAAQFVKLEIVSGFDPDVAFASIADLSNIQTPT
jgi:hypothetical protein